MLDHALGVRVVDGDHTQQPLAIDLSGAMSCHSYRTRTAPPVVLAEEEGLVPTVNSQSGEV
ncbi:hypothetical protein ACFV0H_11190 [Streptomyces erythrochromogenes]|uniref:hypothetical protein n=1 Tax=Streptomyces erythrochromogenes TaxID=285574 RepID=UPI0036810409